MQSTSCRQVLSSLPRIHQSTHAGNLGGEAPMSTWWLIPLSKWVITPVINGISRVNPLITGVITHLLSGMSHQVSAKSIKILK